MFERQIGEYLRLQKWVLVAIVVVFAARWGLTSAGIEAGRWASITGVLIIGTVYYGVVVHTSGFGSYRQLYPLNLFQSLLGESLIAVGITVAILTGAHNIFTVPEYVLDPVVGPDGRSWLHVGAHILVVGAVVLPLISWLISSIVMFVTKKLAARAT